jgi:hypothetical protein
LIVYKNYSNTYRLRLRTEKGTALSKLSKLSQWTAAENFSRVYLLRCSAAPLL